MSRIAQNRISMGRAMFHELAQASGELADRDMARYAEAIPLLCVGEDLPQHFRDADAAYFTRVGAAINQGPGPQQRVPDLLESFERRALAYRAASEEEMHHARLSGVGILLYMIYQYAGRPTGPLVQLLTPTRIGVSGSLGCERFARRARVVGHIRAPWDFLARLVTNMERGVRRGDPELRTLIRRAGMVGVPQILSNLVEGKEVPDRFRSFRDAARIGPMPRGESMLGLMPIIPHWYPGCFEKDWTGTARWM